MVGGSAPTTQFIVQDYESISTKQYIRILKFQHFKYVQTVPYFFVFWHHLAFFLDIGSLQSLLYFQGENFVITGSVSHPCVPRYAC